MRCKNEQSNFNGTLNKRSWGEIFRRRKRTGNCKIHIASFSLAVNRRFTRPGEERQADFINIVAWSKLGEFCSKYFKKGQQVGIIGRIQTRTWDDEQGQKRYVTEVIAEEAYFADSKREGEGAANSFDSTFGTMPSTDSSSDFEISSGDDLPF